MGLLRCPKCEAICHDDEEVCHYCGFRLKPAKEESKEDLIDDPVNSELEKLDKDPFAELDNKDPFEEYSNEPKKAAKAPKEENTEVIKTNSDEPEWIGTLKNKAQSTAKACKGWGYFCLLLSVVFFIFIFADQEKVYYSSYDPERYFMAPKSGWITMTMLTFFGFIMLLLVAHGYKHNETQVFKADRHYVVLDGYPDSWKLYIDGVQVSSYRHGRGYNPEVKLSGTLPNGKIALVTIFSVGEFGKRSYKFEVLEKSTHD